MSEVPKGTESWTTPEFFESNARADDIRTACIPVLQKVHKLLYDPQIESDRNERRRLYAQLEQDDGKLLEMGIRPGMATGKDLQEYQKNPLVTAQYLAGQLLDLIGGNTPSRAESTDSIGENTSTLQDNVKMIETVDLSPSTHEFIIDQQMFTFISEGFAIDKATLSG
jgi:hypothetical protein